MSGKEISLELEITINACTWARPGDSEDYIKEETRKCLQRVLDYNFDGCSVSDVKITRLGGKTP